MTLISMTVPIASFSDESAPAFAAAEESESPPPIAVSSDDTLHQLPHAAKIACLREVAQRLSPALLHVAHQSTAKSRDRALAALIVLIYGPTPFGGANNVKDVAIRYGMTEQNLHQLIGTLRSLLQPPPEPEERDGSGV